MYQRVDRRHWSSSQISLRQLAHLSDHDMGQRMDEQVTLQRLSVCGDRKQACAPEVQGQPCLMSEASYWRADARVWVNSGRSVASKPMTLSKGSGDQKKKRTFSLAMVSMTSSGGEPKSSVMIENWLTSWQIEKMTDPWWWYTHGPFQGIGVYPRAFPRRCSLCSRCRLQHHTSAK